MTQSTKTQMATSIIAGLTSNATKDAEEITGAKHEADYCAAQANCFTPGP